MDSVLALLNCWFKFSIKVLKFVKQAHICCYEVINLLTSLLMDLEKSFSGVELLMSQVFNSVVEEVLVLISGIAFIFRDL